MRFTLKQGNTPDIPVLSRIHYFSSCNYGSTAASCRGKRLAWAAAIRCTQMLAEEVCMRLVSITCGLIEDNEAFLPSNSELVRSFPRTARRRDVSAGSLGAYMKTPV